MSKSLPSFEKITNLIGVSVIFVSRRQLMAGRIAVSNHGRVLKRLKKRIDMKRNTPSMGIVESIEYDPNRSSRVALVRWIDWMQPRCQRKHETIEEYAPPRKTVEPTSTTIRGLFSVSSMSGKVDQRKEDCFSPGLTEAHLVVGLPTEMHLSKSPVASTYRGAGNKKACVKDVFISACSSPRAMEETKSLSFDGNLRFPRIAVAGAKPAFFASRMKEEVSAENTSSLCEVRKWRREHSLGK